MTWQQDSIEECLAFIKSKQKSQLETIRVPSSKPIKIEASKNLIRPDDSLYAIKDRGVYTAKLTWWLEQQFNAFQGLARAKTFNFSTQDDTDFFEYLERQAELCEENQNIFERHSAQIAEKFKPELSYVYIGYAAKKGPECEKNICDLIRKDFEKILTEFKAANPGKTPKLFWRRKPDLVFEPGFAYPYTSVTFRAVSPDIDLSLMGSACEAGMLGLPECPSDSL